jgi:hypothetical protein
MKKVMEKPGEGGNLSCAEMMRSMMKGCGSIKEESKQTKEEEGYD